MNLTQKKIKEGVNYSERQLFASNDLDKGFIEKNLNLDEKRILDFGCGMGGFALWFSSKVNHKKLSGIPSS